jgi:hypothetical protein
MIITSLDCLWEADTAVMTLYAKENENYRYFLLVVNAFSKYVWTIPLKSIKGIEMVSAPVVGVGWKLETVASEKRQR